MRQKLAPLLLSLLILGTLTIQASVSFFCYQSGSFLAAAKIICPTTLYPFVDYPMYSKVHCEGEELPQYKLFAVLEDSRDVEVEPWELGLNTFLFNKFMSHMHGDNRSEIRQYFESYETQHGTRVVEARLEDHAMIFTRTGLEPAPPKVVKTLRLEIARDEP